MTKLSKAPTKLLEMFDLNAVYVDGLGRIDDGGAVSHLIFYVRRHQSMDGTVRVVALRVVIPTAELQTMARQLATPDIASQSSGGVADMPSDDLPRLMN
jgi:hypothetical protein